MHAPRCLTGLSLTLFAAASVGAQPAALELKATPEMRIDGAAQDLASVGPVLVARDGSLVVTEYGDGVARFFSQSGAPTGRFGRKGQGPGEFGNISRGGWVGDTLWLYDGQQSRTTFVTPERQYARSVSFQSAHPAPTDSGRIPSLTSVAPTAAYPGNVFLVGGAVVVGRSLPRGYDTLSRPLMRVTETGLIKAVVGEIPENHSWITATVGRYPASSAIPFAPRPLDAYAPDGSRVVTATTKVAGSSGGTFRIVATSGTGDTVFAREFAYMGIPIPARIADSVATRWRSGAPLPPGDQRDALVAAIAKAGPLSPTYPPLTTLTAGRDGSVWVGLTSPDSSKRFLVLDQRGMPYGRVTLPSKVFVVAAQLDAVWTLELDADDVQSIVRYRVTRP